MVRKLIADASATFGTIDAPAGVVDYNIAAGGGDAIGILVFITRFIQLIFVIAGIWVMYNVISAGFIYLGAEGDSKAHSKVKDQITMSVIGLIIIVASYGIASIIGLIFFGRADFILNPIIQGPTP
ncbi:MAG: hypothetical protein OEX81_03165 [Candidatus Pacebacteria bacterium]|nr:hypothetical protein [Candidatus Paceibacterota bacterium]